MRIWLFILCTTFSCLSAAINTHGSHLVVDCKGCNIDKISCSCNLAAFIKTLADDIGLHRNSEPAAEYFEPTPDKAGFALALLAENGTVTGRFFENSGDACIDIIACIEFSSKTAVKAVQDFLEPKDIQAQAIIRPGL